MARSDFKTWLPLDRWCEIIGIHPFHFNQLDGGTLTPNTVCGEVFFQHAYQHSDRVGRDEIAMAIQQAEKEIAAEVGYNLIPDWVSEERLEYPQAGVPEAFGTYGLNVRGLFKSVELKRGHVISGGVKTKTLIEAGVAITREDDDTDGYKETVKVTVATTVTDVNEIHVYYPAKDGADGWEIRPITVSISGGNATITFKAWQIVAANQFDALNPDPLDATDNASYESTVDVYRVYNDPSTQLQFLWEGDWDGCGSCAACQLSSQAGCFHLRDTRLGIIVPAPGSWDSDTEEFVQSDWSACRDPDQVRVWYYSGYRNPDLTRSYVTMDPYWEYAVAFYAASKLDRPVCGCSNVNSFIDKWRLDAMVVEGEKLSFNVTPEIMSNKLGTTMGAIYAYKRIHQNGIRVTK